MGGRTIAEAKLRMSNREAIAWGAFMQKRGPLSMQRRMNWPVGLIGMYLDRMAGGKKEMSDFMPYEDHQDDFAAMMERF